MKKLLSRLFILSFASIMSLGFLFTSVYAEDAATEPNTTESQTAAPATTGASISLMPVSKTLEIQSDAIYDSSFQITNDGDTEIKIEVYAAPYSYVYSESDDTYKLGFSNENNFTQISRWITIQNTEGNFTERATFPIAPKETRTIIYRITTPSNIPAGGQYAVIFSQTISSPASSTGIRTEASAGMIVYGHSSEGETITAAEISDLKIDHNFHASAKIKNSGNTDFGAYGTLKIDPIIGSGSYETPANAAKLSVIPESKRVLEDQWTENVPNFGIFKAVWTVTAADKTETIERVIFLIPPYAAFIIISLLTIITIWIIITVRKRKERRSRLSV